MNNHTRIAKNTLFLYGQLFLSMLIGLYTSRVVLNVLGVNDFGIFNVIGGLVGLFGILNAAMSSSSSRFITYELGRGSPIEKLKAVFSTSLSLHLGIAVVICLVTLLAGGWLLITHMQIPVGRMDAASWVFYGTVAAIFFSIINVPYTAAIVAHERMSVFAYLTILELVLKLGIVFLLQVIDFDKLKIYAALTVLVQIIMRIVSWFYCIRNFEEVRVGMSWNKPLLKEMTSFAGWSLFGDAAVALYTEGVNILLNIFFGTSINAARGIAVQVQGLVYRFVTGFQTAVNPQITKSYAANDLTNMHKLIYVSSKFSFLMFLLFALPVLFETESILTWWLKIVPGHTVNFVRVMILISLIDTLANPLVFAAKATGKIKVYQSVVGGLLLLVVPLSYAALKLGLPPESVFVINLIIVIIGQIARVWLIKSMIELPLREYFIKVIYRCCVVVMLSPIIPYMFYKLLDESFYRFVIILFTSGISIIALGYALGLDKSEKLFLSKSFNWFVRKYSKPSISNEKN